MGLIKKNEISRLAYFMKPRAGRYISSLLLFCILESTLSTGIAFFLKDLINLVLKGNTFEIEEFYVHIFWGILIILLIPVFRYIFIWCVRRVMMDIRMAVFERISRFPIKYFEDNHCGDLFSRITNDMQMVEDAYMPVMFSIVHTFVYASITITAMFVIDARIAPFIIVLSMTIAVINVSYIKRLRSLSDKVQEEKSTAVQLLTDILSGIYSIKIFQIGKFYMKKYHNQYLKVSKECLKRTKIEAALESLNYLLSLLSFVGIIIIGSIGIIYGLTDFGTISAMIILQMNLGFVIILGGSITKELQRALAGTSRLFGLLNIEAEKSVAVHNDKRNDLKVNKNCMISMDKVNFGYSNPSKILKDVSLDIEKGKMTAIVGTSGSGKSTMLKLLLRFYNSDEDITIDGKYINAYDLKELRDMIAYVPQDGFLFIGTIKENILHGRSNATEEEIISAAIAANAHDFIKALPDGYDTKVEEGGSNLSGGQRQRIAIARAVLKDAPILFLDESTSALDSDSEREIQEALNVLMKGKTALVVAHRLSTIRDASKVYVMDNGNIVESGTHEELKEKKGYYYKLYKEFAVK